MIGAQPLRRASYASYASCVAGAADALGNPDAPGTAPARGAPRRALLCVAALALAPRPARLAPRRRRSATRRVAARSWLRSPKCIRSAPTGRCIRVRLRKRSATPPAGSPRRRRRPSRSRKLANWSPPPAVRSTHREPAPVPLTEALPGSSIATLATAYFAADQLTARPRARGEPVLDAGTHRPHFASEKSF